jgi:hypothetical protein
MLSSSLDESSPKLIVSAICRRLLASEDEARLKDGDRGLSTEGVLTAALSASAAH